MIILNTRNGLMKEIDCSKYTERELLEIRYFYNSIYGYEVI